MAKTAPTMPVDNREDLSRRDVVYMIVGSLIAAALAGVGSLSLVFRFMRPKMEPFNLIQAPDTADVDAQAVANLGQLQEPWESVAFIFRQVNIEYTPRGQQTTEIPGFVVKLPSNVPNNDATGNELDVVSRICPHLGCIFNFEDDPDDVYRRYGGFRPPGPVFACPCHLSIYDPAQENQVISGPAPNPPSYFEYDVQGDDVVILAAPKGLA